MRMFDPILTTAVASCLDDDTSCLDDNKSSPTVSRAWTSEIRPEPVVGEDEYQTCSTVLKNIASPRCLNRNTCLIPTCDSTMDDT